VLAAGEGTRMRSARPKPLHRICGRPMILHVLDALAELRVDRVVVVVGHRGEWVTKTLSENAPRGVDVEFVEQATQGGTGDALAVALTAFPHTLADSEGDLIVLPGDTPLVRPPTLAGLVRHHRLTDAAATLLTARVHDSAGRDRVVRGRNDQVVGVLDESEVEYDPEFGNREFGTREFSSKNPDEGNTSGISGGGTNGGSPNGGSWDEVATAIACYRHGVLAAALRRLQPVGPRREHSLTGMPGVLHDAGYTVTAVVLADAMEAAGVNDRAQLAVAEAELRDRINERWMRRGVTMWDPERTYVDTSVELEPDAVLLPGVILQGGSKIAAGAEVGPDCRLVDTTVGEGSVVVSSVADRAEIGASARVGPYCVLRPGARVRAGEVVAPYSEADGE
jgi:bifunctional UDP-N-acetylglucosamine pyrophosphorylase/glucosamine-1-phosphate N-acetyltransferase